VIHRIFTSYADAGEGKLDPRGRLNSQESIPSDER
jgi:hypothetical protein